MVSDESDDEPLSNLAAKKKSGEYEYEPPSSSDEEPKKKKKKKELPAKKLGVTIKLNRKLNSLVGPAVIERPSDVWLYLKDLNPTGPYSCLLCTDWFINRSKMILHYALNHKKDFCGICRYFVPDRSAWFEHEKFHSPWPCSQCVETFSTDVQLRFHLSSIHNLVHCRLCHFRVTADDDYSSHLFQKHNVTNAACQNDEQFWQVDYEGDDKFMCSLCSKPDLLCSTFFAHYMGFHHFTLKCLTHLIAGKNTSFLVEGADVTDRFVNEQLKGHVRLGYVDLTPKTDTPKIVKENIVPIEIVLPEVKQEIVSDHEEQNNVPPLTPAPSLTPAPTPAPTLPPTLPPTFPPTPAPVIMPSDDNAPKDDTIPKDENIAKDENSQSSDSILTYKGSEDYDVTVTEMIVIERSYFDYVNQLLASVNEDVVPQLSHIDYDKLKSDMLNNVSCPLCTTKLETVQSFSTHMNKVHSVKTVPLYSCRVCATFFDTYNELANHTACEFADFDDLWICQFCDKEFDNREATREHLTEHWTYLDYENCFSPHIGFKCKYCSTLFWNENDRETHQLRVHFHKYKEHFYKCDTCAKTFGDKVWYIHHYLEKHCEDEDKAFLVKCCLCCSVLESVEEMRSHFASNHAEVRKMYCSLEPCMYKPLSHRKSFKLHVKMVHGAPKPEKVVHCNVCQREFQSARACSTHMAQIHGPGKFKCKLCKEVLQTLDERKLHYLLCHPGRHPFECVDCGKSFQYKSSLYMHRQDHQPNKQTYTCSYCAKTFAKKDSYREHVQIHEGPRHACSYCPMRFVQRSNMLRHERRHTGERPYRCAHCPRAFADKGACTAHTRYHHPDPQTHSKDRSYACLYCGQTFVQKSKLTYHIRKHTGENLEACPVCSKLFTSACSLREHMKTHLTKRQIVKCPLCDKGYADERYMLRHLRTSHTRSQFSCPICTKLLTSAAGLRHHVITHSPLNTFRCKCCPKSYAVKRTIIKHLRKRHGLKGGDLNLKDFYTRLEPRECQLKLDETTMTTIFGPPKKPAPEVLIADFVTFSKKISFAQNIENNNTDDTEDDNEANDGKDSDNDHEHDVGSNSETEEQMPRIKQEVVSGDELEPTDFVSVKIEPMEDDNVE